VSLYRNSENRTLFYTISDDAHLGNPKLAIYLNKNCQATSIWANGDALSPEQCLHKQTLEKTQGCDMLGYKQEKLKQNPKIPSDFTPDSNQLAR
jgi:hypothetical protein